MYITISPQGKEKEAYTIEEIQAMLTILPEPAATVVETAAWTGLRASELRGLTCRMPSQRLADDVTWEICSPLDLQNEAGDDKVTVQ